MNNRCMGMLVIAAGSVLIACGRPDDHTTQAGSSGGLITVPNGLQGPEETTYIPPVINGLMVVDLSRGDDKDPIPITANTMIHFQHPPQNTVPMTWMLEYDEQYFTKVIDGVNQSYHQDFMEPYPANGWIFTIKKTGMTEIMFTSVNQNLNGLYQNIYRFEITP